MCFVPVEPKNKETYRHVHKEFIVTVPYDPKKIEALADALGIPKSDFSKFGPGKILIVNDHV